MDIGEFMVFWVMTLFIIEGIRLAALSVLSDKAAFRISIAAFVSIAVISAIALYALAYGMSCWDC